jgi:hypothetical protein
MHDSSAEHRLPQTPQLTRSVCASTQVVPHCILGSHPVRHSPPTQRDPLGQRFPHTPQLVWSTIVCAQTPPQSVAPVGHGLAISHAPSRQSVPAGHARLQPPQCSMELAVFTHTPSQARVLPAQNTTLLSLAPGPGMGAPQEAKAPTTSAHRHRPRILRIAHSLRRGIRCPRAVGISGIVHCYARARGATAPKVRHRSPERFELFKTATCQRLASDFTLNVCRVREARGSTQEEAAYRSRELDPAMLRTIEAGDANLTITPIARLCDGLETSVIELFVPAPPLQKRPPGRPRKSPMTEVEPK